MSKEFSYLYLLKLLPDISVQKLFKARRKLDVKHDNLRRTVLFRHEFEEEYTCIFKTKD